MPVSADQILTTLWIIAAVMLIVVLYHVLFVVVDLRKISRRFNDLTEQVESVLLKPLSMADHILQWVIDQIENQKKKSKKK